MKKKPEPQYYIVEADIPMPRARQNILRTKKNRFPYADMRVNDSFLCEPHEEVRAIYTSMKNFIKKYNIEWEFTIRRMPDQCIRVWRTK